MASIEGKASLDDRYAQLRSQFHAFQVKSTLSKQDSPPENMFNLIKCYEFLNQLELLFQASNVLHLFEFVRAIFTMGYGFIKEIVGDGKKQAQAENNLKLKTAPLLLQIPQNNKEVQTEDILCTDLKQRTGQIIHKKRNCLSIDIQEALSGNSLAKSHHRGYSLSGAQSNLHPSPSISSAQTPLTSHPNIEEFRSLLQAKQQSGDLSQFTAAIDEYRPIMTEVFNFSGVDETIKTAIDKFKDSQQKCRQFLNIYEHMKVRESKCKIFAELWGKQNKSKVSKWMGKWKEYKDRSKARLAIAKSEVNHCIWAWKDLSSTCKIGKESKYSKQEQFYNQSTHAYRNLSSFALYDRSSSLKEDPLSNFKTKMANHIDEIVPHPSVSSLAGSSTPYLSIPTGDRRTIRNSAFSKYEPEGKLRILRADSKPQGDRDELRANNRSKINQSIKMASVDKMNSLGAASQTKARKSILLKQGRKKTHLLFKRSTDGP